MKDQILIIIAVILFAIVASFAANFFASGCNSPDKYRYLYNAPESKRP